MFGFFGKYGNDVEEYDLSLLTKDNCIYRKYSHDGLVIQHKTLNKFLNDKVFCDDEKYFFLLEGVILNDDELYMRYSVNDELKSLLPYLYETEGETFWNVLRGSFSGVFYDKKNDILLVYTDHIGSKFVFYASINNTCYFSSDLKILIDTLSKSTHLQYSIQFAYSMLTFGYSPNYQTIIDRIQRLPAGHYIKMQDGKMTVNKYHQFTNLPSKTSLDENVEQLDVLFRQALTRILRKNEQYGYDNYMPLSAGLDSRIVTCVGNQLAKNPIYSITYSQTGYYDETIPKEISKYLGTKMIFTALDGGEYLKKIDESVSRTCGLIHYSGPAQVMEGVKKIDLENVGVIATGMHGGDVVGTSFTKKSYSQKPFWGFEAYSLKLLPSLKKHLSPQFYDIYSNQEIYSLYVRGFSCANLGSPIIFQDFTESYSPFCDVDFLEFAYSIDVKQRWDHVLYDAWILKKYPEMAKWKHNGTREIGEKEYPISVFSRRIPMKSLLKRTLMFILKKTRTYNFELITNGTSMNPIDSWLRDNDSLQNYFDNYLKNNEWLLQIDKQLQADAKYLYKNGTGMEKMQVLTLLATMKNYMI